MDRQRALDIRLTTELLEGFLGITHFMYLWYTHIGIYMWSTYDIEYICMYDIYI